jgi:hypothetical protein
VVVVEVTGGGCTVVLCSVVVVVAVGRSDEPQPASRRAPPSIAPVVRSRRVEFGRVMMSLLNQDIGAKSNKSA